MVRASAPLPSVAELFSFTVPLALTYTLPMSVLVGILIGLSRLAADSEVTAMRACGMGIWSFLRSLSAFVLLGVAACPGEWRLHRSPLASRSRPARGQAQGFPSLI